MINERRIEIETENKNKPKIIETSMKLVKWTVVVFEAILIRLAYFVFVRK